MLAEPLKQAGVQFRPMDSIPLRPGPHSLTPPLALSSPSPTFLSHRLLGDLRKLFLGVGKAHTLACSRAGPPIIVPVPGMMGTVSRLIVCEAGNGAGDFRKVGMRARLGSEVEEEQEAGKEGKEEGAGQSGGKENHLQAPPLPVPDDPFLL